MAHFIACAIKKAASMHECVCVCVWVCVWAVAPIKMQHAYDALQLRRVA